MKQSLTNAIPFKEQGTQVAKRAVGAGSSWMTTIKSVILGQRSSVETTQQKSEVSTNEGTSVEDVMTFITALRKKHHPLVDVQCLQCSTVGLVVEGGRHISAVVPGGPCDREFNGGLIETGGGCECEGAWVWSGFRKMEKRNS